MNRFSSTSSSSSSSFSAASRWLNRRAKEGVFVSEIDSEDILENQIASSRSNNSLKSTNEVHQSLPSAVLSTSQHTSFLSSLSNASSANSLLLQSKKVMPKLQNSLILMSSSSTTTDDAFFDEKEFQMKIASTLQSYLTLTSRLLSSSSKFWDESTNAFSEAINVKTNNSKDAASTDLNRRRDLFIKLAKRSSPLWVVTWIDQCQAILAHSNLTSTATTSSSKKLLVKNSTTANNTPQARKLTRQEKQQLIDCCERISKSILPLCTREMNEKVQSSLLDLIEKEKQKLIHEAKSLISVFEKQLENNQWNAALRNFLMHRETFTKLSFSSSTTVGEKNSSTAQVVMMKGIDDAATFSFDSAVSAYYRAVVSSSKSRSLLDGGISSILLADQQQQQHPANNKTPALSHQQATLNQTLESSLQSWMSSRNSVDLQLRLLNVYCGVLADKKVSSSLLSSAVNDKELINFLDNSLLSAATVSVNRDEGNKNNNNVTATTTNTTGFLTYFLADSLAPTTINSNKNSARSLAKLHIDNSWDHQTESADATKLSNSLPLLSTISLTLAKSSINTSDSKTLSSVLMMIHRILSGKCITSHSSSKQQRPSSSPSRLTTITQLLVTISKQSDNNVATQKTLSVITDAFRVAAIALAMFVDCPESEIQEKLIIMNPGQQTSSLITSHWRNFILSRAKLLSSILVKNYAKPSFDQKLNILSNVLGMQSLAVKEAAKVLLFHQTNEEDRKNFLVKHSSLLLSQRENFRQLVVADTEQQQQDKEQQLRIWQLALQVIQNNSNKLDFMQHQRLFVQCLLDTANWRAAVAIAPPRDVSELCQQIISIDHSNRNSSSSSAHLEKAPSYQQQWQVAVGLLTELSQRNLRLKPFALMTLLKVLDAPSAPEEMSVNLTIQMETGKRAAKKEQQTGHDSNNNGKQLEIGNEPASSNDSVVNLLVSVTRAVLRQHHTRGEGGQEDSIENNSNNSQHKSRQKLDGSSIDAENQQDASDDTNTTSSSSLLRARVFALSSLLSVSSSSAAVRRKQVSSLRSAMLLCADAGDWQSAFYLISTASDKMPEFRLSPDVIWKITKALELSEQHARVDVLKEYVSGRDVADWLQSEDDNLLLEKSFTGGDNNNTNGSRISDNSRDASSSASHESHNKNHHQANQMMINGTLVSDFVKIRCNAIHRAAAVGKWKVATSLFSDVIEANERVRKMEEGPNSTSSFFSSELLAPIERALSSTVKVCSLRRHWQDALNAMNAFAMQQQQHEQQSSSSAIINNLRFSDQVSTALIRCLSVYGRWQEATSLFQSLMLNRNNNTNNHQSNRIMNSQSSSSFYEDDETREQHKKRLSSLFTYLTRACRLSSAWMPALQLHSSQPSLVSFSSVSEVVGACSACGFPLTKIQLWLNLSKSSLFLVSASLKKSDSSLTHQNGQEEQEEDTTLEELVRSPDLSSVDLAVFFALLNAQSYYTFDSSSSSLINRLHNNSKNIRNNSSYHQQQNSSSLGSPALAWIRSLQLLQACWMTKSGASSSIARSTAAPYATNDTSNDENSSSSSNNNNYFSAAREPECVTSVIDTCVKQGKWMEAFQVYRMQKMLMVPSTTYAVYILLTSLLEQQQQHREQNNNNNNHVSSSSSSKWLVASRLLSDSLNSNRGGKALQPLVCEKFIQILNVDGKWEQALTFAKNSLLTKTVVLSNDRILDSLVKYSTNATVVLKSALASGTFPVSPHHALGGGVERAIGQALFSEDELDQELAVKALGKCLKTRDVSDSLVGSVRLRNLRTARRNEYKDNNDGESSMEIVTVDQINELIESSKHQHQETNAVQAVDIAFGHAIQHFLTMTMISNEDSKNDIGTNAHFKTACEDLLRFSMLFGIPTKDQLLGEWPKRISELTGAAELDVRCFFEGIAEEMP